MTVGFSGPRANSYKQGTLCLSERRCTCDVHLDRSFDEKIDAEFFGLDAGGQIAVTVRSRSTQFERNRHNSVVNNSYNKDSENILS